MYQNSFAAIAVIEATNKLVDTALESLDIRASPNALEFAVAILAVGENSQFSQVQLRGSEVAARIAEAIVSDDNSQDSDFIRAAVQLKQM